MADNWERLPAPLRERWEARARIAGEPAEDILLADIVEELGGDNLSELTRDAIEVVRFEARTEAANPFVPDGAGTESHYRLLGETLQGIINDTPAYVPKTPPSPAARLRGSTSISTAVTGDAFATVKARIGVVESSGSATAKNPRSSAMGLYQFTDGTWLAYYKARFGSQGLSDAAIIAKKGDTGLQNTLMDDLMADNAKALQEAGFAVDPGNLYLAHFAGRKGATGLLEADPATPAVLVLGENVINANPFLRGKTAGDVIAWAHGKMGGKAPAIARGEAGAPSDVMGAIDREIADTQAELARLDSEIEAAARPATDVIEDLTPDAVRVVDEPPMPRIEAPDGTRAPIGTDGRATVAGMTPEARGAIPKLKGIVERELDLSLNDTAALSARVGVDERNLRMALQQMAIDGLVIQKRNGNFARLPRAKDGPMDVLAYVASTGGVTPKGFSQSLMAIHANMAYPPKGHGLERIFAVEREVRWKRKPDRVRGIEGIPLAEPYRTTRPALIPGYGPIVRSTGRGLDEIGEDLWSAGYFGPPESRPRPTETEVINLLQDAFGSGKKVYSIYDQQRAADLEAEAAASGYADPKNPFASDFQSEEHFLFEWNSFDRAADEAFGVTLDQEAFITAWGEYRTAGDGDVAGAVLRAIQREFDDVQARIIAERGIDDAEDIIAEWEAALRADGIFGSEDGGRPLFEPGDPGPSGPPRGPAEWEETGPLDPERWQHWDEPDGPAAKIDADSMEHDLRVQVGRYGTLTDGGDIGGGERRLTYVGPDGARSEIFIKVDEDGAAQISVDPDRMFSGADGGAAGVNRFGPAIVRDVVTQLKALFPDIRRIEGERLTGAGAGRVQRIELGQQGSAAPTPTITTAADGQADFAAPTGAQVRTALERRTEGGIRPTGEQKAPGSDGGLFDTRAPEADLFDGVSFRLDEEGDVVNPADLLAEFDEDAAFIKTIRDCL